MNMSDELRDVVHKIGRKQEEERAAFERLSPEEKVEKLRKDNERLRRLLRQAREERDELKEASRQGVPTIKTVVCREKMDELHTALLFFCEDGTINVRCPGECFDCPYGRVV